MCYSSEESRTYRGITFLGTEGQPFMRERKKLGEILVDLQVLSPVEVERILLTLERRKDRQRKFGQMGRDMGLIEEEQILAALAVQMKLLPNIDRLTLKEILGSLLAADPAGE